MSSAPAAAPRLRRLPQQARSRERIEAVLAAADQLLATEGAAGLTTTKVAAAAGMSVGSLYQWFPDRDAIAEALALRYVAGFVRVVEELQTTGADPIGDAVDALADAFRREPGFRAMWFGGLRTQALRDLTRPALREVARSVATLVRSANPDVDPAAVAATSDIAVVTADALLRHAFRLDPDGDPVTLTEAKRLLRGYVQDRLAHPDPTAP